MACAAEVCAPRARGAKDPRSAVWAAWLAEATAPGGRADAALRFGERILKDASFCARCRAHFYKKDGLADELQNLRADLKRAHVEARGNARLARSLCILWLSRFHAIVTAAYADAVSPASAEWRDAWQPLMHEDLLTLATDYRGEDLLPWLRSRRAV